MGHTHWMQNPPATNGGRVLKLGACLLLAALVAGGLVLGWSGNSGPTPATTAPASVTPTTPAAAPDAVPTSKPSPAVVVAGQKQAATALAQQPVVAPPSGNITERPDYVSILEWQVLKGIAQQHTDSAAELTHLVNKLRFSKQLDMWHSLANSPDASQRHTLATQLLGDIPARLASKDLDFNEAQKLQQDLLADLITDPQQRSQRAAQEARRLTNLYVTEGSTAASGK